MSKLTITQFYYADGKVVFQVVDEIEQIHLIQFQQLLVGVIFRCHRFCVFHRYMELKG